MRLDGPSAVPLRHSLRGKGLAALAAALLYLVGSVAYVSWVRAQLYEDMQALERLSQHDRVLALAEVAVDNAVVDASEASSAANEELPSAASMRLYMESCTRNFELLEAHDPAYALLRRAIERSYSALEEAPIRVHWIDFREALSRASQALAIRRELLTAQRDRLTMDYHRRYDAVTIQSLLLAIVGFAGFGSVGAWFFSRLTHDVRRLEEHARHIVRGVRGVTLEARRQDEIGQLMHAVNRMSADLDERENQLELEAQRRSHEDKMLAVGALAAGVAHEVNNPLAVIAGLAQELQADAVDGPQRERTAAILAETRRAAQVAQQLATLATPQPAALDLVDLNAIVRGALGLMAYDRRYRGLRFEQALDPQLPALRSSASALQQVTMKLLGLAADALAQGPARPATLTLGTTVDGAWVSLAVEMPPALDFTRPEVQRSLLLVRAAIEPIGGRLAFGQGDEGGGRITLRLPLTTDDPEDPR
jgi:two-component system, NtrC family, sensor kinase